MAAINVFGTRPKDSIFMPNQPFSVRNNCQVGQWCVGDDNYRGNEIEISVIKASQFFGTLGKTKNAQWIQLFFVPAPSCKTLPQNTVCVTYIKTRSASAFWQRVIEVMEAKEPAEGIFRVGYEKHSGEMGTYYSLKWDWRERTAKEEKEQLETIAVFLQGSPRLIDLNASRDLVCIDGLSAEEIDLLVRTTRAKEPAKEVSQPSALSPKR